MSIRKYFKLRDGLPDPKGSLSASIPAEAISLANTEVQKVIDSKKANKRGPYTK